MLRFLGSSEHCRTLWVLVAVFGLTIRGAQSSPPLTTYQVGICAVSPSGNFGDVAGGGGGFDAVAQREIGSRLVISASLGVVSYGGMDLFGVTAQWYGVPAQMGLEYSPASPMFVTVRSGILWKVATVELSRRSDHESEPGILGSLGVGARIGRMRLICDYNVGNKDWKWFAIRARWSLVH